MEEYQTSSVERMKEGDASIATPAPKGARHVLAADSHTLMQSNGISGENKIVVNSTAKPSGDVLPHHSAASGTGLVAIPSEDATPLPALVNGHVSTNGEHLATLQDYQGDPAIFSQDDSFAQTFDPSQVDDDESIILSEGNTIQAFAKLEFDDGEFYMTTHAVELGRDIRAAQGEGLSQEPSRQLEFGVRRSRKRSNSNRSGRPRKRHREHKNYTQSLLSETGGIIGVDLSDTERGEIENPALEKDKSPSSSSVYQSRRSSLLELKKDYNLLTRELESWMVQQVDTNQYGHHPASARDRSPSASIPLIPIHPPANADGTPASHQGISRKHVKIFFNFDVHMFQIIFWGRNGGFVDDAWYATGETVTLVSGSLIQLKGICIRFTLPNVPAGETGAEEAELSEGLTGGNASNDVADSDNLNGAKYTYDIDDVEDESEGELLRSDGMDKPLKQPRPQPEPRPELEAPRPKRKGPGRPPKNGIMSKREQAQQAREARENVKAKDQAKSNQIQGRGKGKTAKARELEASHLQPNGKRKYTKRKKVVDVEEAQNARESTEQDDSLPPEGVNKPAKEKKPIKPPRSPSPVLNEAELTPEQLSKPSSSYVVLIHEALSNSKTGQMSLPQIYRAIERRYPFFKLRVQTLGWQSSVRHNLSQHAAFTKITRDGKGWMWGLVPEVSIEKEKKRRPTPPPAPQQSYQYPPQAQRYQQQAHPYPYPNVPAPMHGAIPFPYAVPPMPYPPQLGPNGIPMPFVQPQAESTYKSPYDSNPDPSSAAPTTTPPSAAKSNGNNGHYPTPKSQTPQHQGSAVTLTSSPALNGARFQPSAQKSTHRYSEEVRTKINTFKIQLISSLNPKSNPEHLVSSVIDHTLYGSALKADEGSDERAILAALENIILAGEGNQQQMGTSSTATAAAAATGAHSAETVAEKAADIARKIRDDK